MEKLQILSDFLKPVEWISRTMLTFRVWFWRFVHLFTAHTSIRSEHRLQPLVARQLSFNLASRLAAGARVTFIVQFEQSMTPPHSGTLLVLYRDGVRCARTSHLSHPFSRHSFCRAENLESFLSIQRLSVIVHYREWTFIPIERSNE